MLPKGLEPAQLLRWVVHKPAVVNKDPDMIGMTLVVAEVHEQDVACLVVPVGYGFAYLGPFKVKGVEQRGVPFSVGSTGPRRKLNAKFGQLVGHQAVTVIKTKAEGAAN